MPSIFPMVLGTQFRALDRLEADWAAGDRPSVIFVEPDYYDSPIHFQEPCDNHPPLAMAPGETFLAKVYGWISSDPARWARTLLIVSYDEHGGCWDHVPPLPVTYTNAAANITFDTTGPRIPAMLAGPFAPRHAVARKPDGTKPSFDNTSILQLLAERFGSPATSYSPDVLARRQQGIDSLSVALDASGANTDRCTFAPARAVAPAVTSTALCRQGFDLALRQMFGAHGEALLAKYPALRGYFD
jgi:phospholipase C